MLEELPTLFCATLLTGHPARAVQSMPREGPPIQGGLGLYAGTAMKTDLEHTVATASVVGFSGIHKQPIQMHTSPRTLPDP